MLSIQNQEIEMRQWERGFIWKPLAIALSLILLIGIVESIHKAGHLKGLSANRGWVYGGALLLVVLSMIYWGHKLINYQARRKELATKTRIEFDAREERLLKKEAELTETQGTLEKTQKELENLKTEQRRMKGQTEEGQEMIATLRLELSAAKRELENFTTEQIAEKAKLIEGEKALRKELSEREKIKEEQEIHQFERLMAKEGDLIKAESELRKTKSELHKTKAELERLQQESNWLGKHIDKRIGRDSFFIHNAIREIYNVILDIIKNDPIPQAMILLEQIVNIRKEKKDLWIQSDLNHELQSLIGNWRNDHSAQLIAKFLEWGSTVEPTSITLTALGSNIYDSSLRVDVDTKPLKDKIQKVVTVLIYYGIDYDPKRNPYHNRVVLSWLQEGVEKGKELQENTRKNTSDRVQECFTLLLNINEKTSNSLSQLVTSYATAAPRIDWQ